MCYVMSSLSIFHLAKADETGKKCLHRVAGWHRYCGLGCFVASLDQIPLWSLKKNLFWHDYFAYSVD